MVREESAINIQGDTTRQLQHKIASLSQSELAQYKDTLVLIWTCAAGPLDLPAWKPTTKLSTNLAALPNWLRVELALLKSIYTGIFIDIQFYAYNVVHRNFPLDPKPLFTSSIVIEEWGHVIITRKL
jgi:hypothetical protein